MSRTVDTHGTLVRTLTLTSGDLAPRRAARRLAELTDGAGAPRVVLGFVSPHLDADTVVRTVGAGLPDGTVLVLLSTAGELCPCETGGVYLPARGVWDSLVLLAFSRALFQDASVHAVPLHSEDIRSGDIRLDHDERIAAIAGGLAGIRPPFTLDCHDTVALTFIDGLAASENHFMEAVYATAGFPVLFVGGSAGGAPHCTDTWIFDGTSVLHNHAVVLFAKLAAGIRYDVLKSQNFRKTETVFTIFDADPVRRTVSTVIDPDTLEVSTFVDALCKALGCGADGLQAMLTRRTFAIDLNGELLVRSVARLDADAGRAVFYCDVNPGDELFLVEATDFVAQTASDVAAFLADKPAPVAGILNDCVLRRLNNLASLGAMTMFDGLPVAGFSTFGELLGINMNQTLSAIFFFAVDDRSSFPDDYASRFPVHYARYQAYFDRTRQNRLRMLDRLRGHLVRSLLDRGDASAVLYQRFEQITACAERVAPDGDGRLSRSTADLVGAVRLARSERNAVAAALSHREEELRLVEARLELEARLRRARKLEALSCLAGGMAHEINNMLLPIIGLTELALEEVPRGGSVHRNLTRVIEAAQRAHAVTAQVLTFGSDDRIRTRPLPLAAVVRNADRIIDLLVPRGVTIRWCIEAEDAVVRTDETQVVQVLINLVRNAADAMEGTGGTITIALEKAGVDSDDGSPPVGRCAVLSVSDTGRGIDPAILERVFDPFFTTKEVGRGTGLGLAAVHGMVTDWGGRIAIDSCVGAGTTVRIILPLCPDGAV
ncbi:ATP-binding protein [Azospirillum halopraeferens]|uniref:ATP-binding protein n=1 Tax=Azospirillum halopraeferens TaxID=34010 RepID=UPI0004038ACF|nr:ATP-binding protein [Azospirillum halopraeferens]